MSPKGPDESRMSLSGAPHDSLTAQQCTPLLQLGFRKGLLLLGAPRSKHCFGLGAGDEMTDKLVSMISQLPTLIRCVDVGAAAGRLENSRTRSISASPCEEQSQSQQQTLQVSSDGMNHSDRKDQQHTIIQSSSSLATAKSSLVQKPQLEQHLNGGSAACDQVGKMVVDDQRVDQRVEVQAKGQIHASQDASASSSRQFIHSQDSMAKHLVEDSPASPSRKYDQTSSISVVPRNSPIVSPASLTHSSVFNYLFPTSWTMTSQQQQQQQQQEQEYMVGFVGPESSPVGTPHHASETCPPVSVADGLPLAISKSASGEWNGHGRRRRGTCQSSYICMLSLGDNLSSTLLIQMSSFKQEILQLHKGWWR
jgi:hypothetical protein